MGKYKYEEVSILQNLRKDAKVTQQEAASFFGMKNRDSVRNWEVGESKPRQSRRLDFIDYLLRKLKLYKQPETFFNIWNKVMVRQWQWHQLDKDEIQPFFHGKITLQEKKSNVIVQINEGQEESVELQLPALDQPILSASPIPIQSHMPLQHNPLFIGRNTELQTIIKALKNKKSIIIGTTGMGGVGKTQLAVEFAHRYGQFFTGGIFWLNFEQPKNIQIQIASCGGPKGLNINNFEKFTLEKQVELVLKEWHKAIPRLLIFDACESEELLARWLPTYGGCRVLVTSRRRKWNQSLGLSIVDVNVLKRNSSKQLLTSFKQDIVSETANQIAEELGDLPLALHLAGSFLSSYQYEFSPEKYLLDLQNLKGKGLVNHPSLSGIGTEWSPTSHELNVAATFALSFDKLDEQNQTDILAKDLLGKAACLAFNEPIPRKLLSYTFEDNDLQPLQFSQAINRLVNLGLLQELSEGDIRIHKLINDFVNNINDTTYVMPVAKAVFKLAFEENSQANFSQLKTWQSHLFHIINLVKTIDSASLESDLCDELGYYLQMIGKYDEAHKYFSRSVLIRQQLYGENNKFTAISLSYLGYLLKLMGAYDESETSLIKVLNIRKKVLGLNHLDTARSFDDLGLLFIEVGKYSQATECLENALKIREYLEGPKSAWVASSYNNLGLLYNSIGNFEKAEEYYQKAIKIREDVYGHDHPFTVVCYSNLGGLLITKGDLSKAKTYLDKALSVRKSTFGLLHPSTAITLHKMGSLFRNQEDWEKAKQILEQALNIRVEIFGEKHEVTAFTLNELGKLYISLGQWDTAQQYFNQAKENLDNSKIGVDNLEKVTSLLGLAKVCIQKARFQAAKKHVISAIDICNQLFEKPNRITAQCLYILGTLAHIGGEFSHAQNLLENALEIKQEILGNWHVETGEILYKLGMVQQSKNNYSIAQTYLEQALKIFRKVLGNEHIFTQITKWHLKELASE